jgi:hypothetical protein
MPPLQTSFNYSIDALEITGVEPCSVDDDVEFMLFFAGLDTLL